MERRLTHKSIIDSITILTDRILDIINDDIKTKQRDQKNLETISRFFISEYGSLPVVEDARQRAPLSPSFSRQAKSEKDALIPRLVKTQSLPNDLKKAIEFADLSIMESMLAFDKAHKLDSKNVPSIVNRVFATVFFSVMLNKEIKNSVSFENLFRTDQEAAFNFVILKTSDVPVFFQTENTLKLQECLLPILFLQKFLLLRTIDQSADSKDKFRQLRQFVDDRSSGHHSETNMEENSLVRLVVELVATALNVPAKVIFLSKKHNSSVKLKTLDIGSVNRFENKLCLVSHVNDSHFSLFINVVDSIEESNWGSQNQNFQRAQSGNNQKKNTEGDGGPTTHSQSNTVNQNAHSDNELFFGFGQNKLIPSVRHRESEGSSGMQPSLNVSGKTNISPATNYVPSRLLKDSSDMENQTVKNHEVNQRIEKRNNSQMARQDQAVRDPGLTPKRVIQTQTDAKGTVNLFGRQPEDKEKEDKTDRTYIRHHRDNFMEYGRPDSDSKTQDERVPKNSSLRSHSVNDKRETKNNLSDKEGSKKLAVQFGNLEPNSYNLKDNGNVQGFGGILRFSQQGQHQDDTRNDSPVPKDQGQNDYFPSSKGEPPKSSPLDIKVRIGSDRNLKHPGEFKPALPKDQQTKTLNDEKAFGIPNESSERRQTNQSSAYNETGQLRTKENKTGPATDIQIIKSESVSKKTDPNTESTPQGPIRKTPQASNFFAVYPQLNFQLNSLINFANENTKTMQNLYRPMPTGITQIKRASRDSASHQTDPNSNHSKRDKSTDKHPNYVEMFEKSLNKSDDYRPNVFGITPPIVHSMETQQNNQGIRLMRVNPQLTDKQTTPPVPPELANPLGNGLNFKRANQQGNSNEEAL
jgi:hypothetical protein